MEEMKSSSNYFHSLKTMKDLLCHQLNGLVLLAFKPYY